MNKRQAQLQKLLEELLPENLEGLFKETRHSFDSAVDSAKDATPDRAKLESMGRDAWDSLDQDKIEKWARELLRSLEPEKLEKWARESIRSLDADKLKRLLRDNLRGLDKDKLEALLAEGVQHVDRRKLEKRLRESIRKLDLDKIKQSARSRWDSLNVDENADKLDEWVRDQLDKLSTKELEALLGERLSQVDRRKLEKRLRNSVRSVDLNQLTSSARRRLDSLDLDDLSVDKVDEFVRARVDSALLERLAALSTEDLEALIKTKRNELANEATKFRGKAASKIAGSTFVVEPKELEIKKHEPSNPIVQLFSTFGRLAVLSAVGWIAYSHLLLEHQVPLPKAIAADLMTLSFRRAGPISAYHDHKPDGRPLVLIHSINAAASAYEVRPIFRHYRDQRPVYALDLPGFGFSARPDVEYSPDTYVEAIITLLSNLNNNSSEPADVVALSLSSEFAAEAARRRPELFHSLAVISPTGMYKNDSARSSQAAGTMGIDKLIYPLLSFRLWARPFYDVLTTKRSIRYFLQRSFVGSVPAEMVDYSYATAHQPGAEHAPLYFVSGKLFTENAIDRIYSKVKTPSLAIYDRDAFVSFDRLPELMAANSAWQEKRVAPSLGLPQWERPEQTFAALDDFWQSLA